MPTSDPVAGGEPRLRIAAAIVLGLAISATTIGLLLPAWAAERSTLRFDPDQPRQGDLVRVEYTPAGLFGSEDRLVLRGQFRTSHELREQPPTTAVAILRRSGSRFLGSFTLPDSVLYATFAVEDTGGRAIDTNARRLWEIMAHAPDGRPLLEAFRQRDLDLQERSWDRARATAESAVKAYPDHPGAWVWVRSRQLDEAGTDATVDSLDELHRQRFDQLEAALTGDTILSGDELAWMVWYAAGVRDSAAVQFWINRLLAEAPGHVRAVQVKAVEFFAAHQDEPERLLREFDRIWRTGAPVHWQIPWLAASAAGDAQQPEQFRRWVMRLAEVAGRRADLLILGQLNDPTLRPSAMDLLRWRLSDGRFGSRSLLQTAPEHAEAEDTERARLLAALGAALAAEGRVAAAVDTLEKAVTGVWDPRVFELLVQGYLSLGDTAAAVDFLARLAVDPGLPPDSADALRHIGEAVGAGVSWDHRLLNARQQMVGYTLAEAVAEPVHDLRLRDLDGRRTTLFEEAAGRIQVVALWSGYRGSTGVTLEALARLRNRLSPAAQMLVLTTDLTPDRIREQLGVAGGPPSVFIVTRADLLRTFHGMTPRYFVLDPHGRLRFTSSREEDVLRQVETLRWAEAAGTVVSGAKARNEANP